MNSVQHHALQHSLECCQYKTHVLTVKTVTKIAELGSCAEGGLTSLQTFCGTWHLLPGADCLEHEALVNGYHTRDQYSQGSHRPGALQQTQIACGEVLTSAQLLSTIYSCSWQSAVLLTPCNSSSKCSTTGTIQIATGGGDTLNIAQQHKSSFCPDKQ